MSAREGRSFHTLLKNVSFPSLIDVGSRTKHKYKSMKHVKERIAKGRGGGNGILHKFNIRLNEYSL